MTIHHAEKFSRGTILRNGVGSRSQAVVGVVALCVGVEDSSEIVLFLVGILLLIKAYIGLVNDIWGECGGYPTVGGCLPNINSSILQRFSSINVGYFAVHVDNLSIRRRVESDSSSILPMGSILSPKRSKNSRRREAICALGSCAEGDVVHESYAVSFLFFVMPALRITNTHDSRPMTSQRSCPSFLLLLLI